MALAVVAAARAATNEFTLPQAIEMALRDNRNLRDAGLQLENSRFGAEAAATQFAWTLRPDGAASDANTMKYYQAGVFADKTLQNGTQIETGPEVSSSRPQGGPALKEAFYRVQITQPLFRRQGELVNRESLVREENAELTARRNLELSRNDLVVQVVVAHEGLVRLQQQEEFDKQTYQRLDRLCRLTASR